MSFKKVAILILCIALHLEIASQNTVGVVSYNPTDTYNGLTLFTSNTETYLINNCGEVINQWTSAYPSGHAVYLLEDGSLLRAGRIGNTDISIGGAGGIIEKYDWDGNLTWSYTISSNTALQHHDIYPLPNGNILALVLTVMSNSEAIQAGRDPNSLPDSTLNNEQIIELQPVGADQANIVWEWNIKDHLIQDFDATKDNFGVVEDHPELLDINFLNGLGGNTNWLHMNSIQYNESLDQIVMSSRHLSEIYIIDHSTSTAEASSNTGGIYNKGGDFLYRWGNPQAYRQGTENEKQLFGQHYPHWIPEGVPDAGKLILFNNGFLRTPSFSEVFILTPPTTAPGVYEYVPNTAYGPVNTDYTYTNPDDPTNFFSRILSGAQMLPNGNIFICDGDSGYFFEIDSNENIVWEYINPSGVSGILSQGDDPEAVPNTSFRATKYYLDDPAFTGKDLTPGNPIEQNSETNVPCDVLSINEFTFQDLTLYPNPAQDRIKVRSTSLINKIEVYNSLGALMNQVHNTNEIDVSHYNSGLYFLRIYSNSKFVTKKIIKQ